MGKRQNMDMKNEEPVRPGRSDKPPKRGAGGYFLSNHSPLNNFLRAEERGLSLKPIPRPTFINLPAVLKHKRSAGVKE
jgi:hypothetical protein